MEKHVNNMSIKEQIKEIILMFDSNSYIGIKNANINELFLLVKKFGKEKVFRFIKEIEGEDTRFKESILILKNEIESLLKEDVENSFISNFYKN